MLTSLSPRIIDRYIFKEVLSNFFGAVLFFTFVLMMGQIIVLVDFLVEGGATLGQFFQIMSLGAVSYLPYCLPAAFLISILTAFGRFSADSEIVAFKSSGYSLSRIAVPSFAFALLVSVVGLLLNLTWVPWAETSIRKMKLRIGNSRFTTAIREGTFASGIGNLLIYTEKANSLNGRLERVFIYDERNKNQPLTVVSKTGDLVRVAGKVDELQGILMQLQDGSLHRSEIGNEDYSRINFGVYQIWIDLEGSVGELSIKPKMYTLNELLKERSLEQSRTQRWIDLTTELQRRIAIALAPIAFIWIGIGFGTSRIRTGKSSSILFSVLVAIAYWQMQVTVIYWSNQGQFPAAVLLQIPNFLALLVGAYFFKRAAW